MSNNGINPNLVVSQTFTNSSNHHDQQAAHEHANNMQNNDLNIPVNFGHQQPLTEDEIQQIQSEITHLISNFQGRVFPDNGQGNNNEAGPAL